MLLQLPNVILNSFMLLSVWFILVTNNVKLAHEPLKFLTITNLLRVSIIDELHWYSKYLTE